MPFFSYKGRDTAGELITGTLESTDSKTLAGILRSRSITPVEINQSSTDVSVAAIEFHTLFKRSFFGEKIQTLDIMLFSRQMYTLLKAGIPIMKALDGLQASTKNQALARVIGDIRASLDSGRELSACLREHPDVFSHFYISMVRVGETTGMLDSVFLRLFDHLEFERFMHDQIKAALRYPTFVIATMAIALVIVNIFVIPAFAKVFSSMGAELPLLTQVLLGFSGFMVKNWPFLLMGLIALFYGFKYYIKTPEGHHQWDTFKLNIPIAGKIIHKGTMAKFARSFALASKSGVPIIYGLNLVAETVDNSFIAGKVQEMRVGVERGESIFRTASQAGVFSPIVLQMIAVGEESGALDDLMQEIADMYQRDVEYEIKTLGSQIEPILIVFLGVMVLILALGIFLPIWDLGKVAMHRS